MALTNLLDTIPQQAKAGLEVVLNSVAEGICGADAKGNATFCNDAFLAMIGYRSHELIGRNLHQLIHHSRRDGSPYPTEECPMLTSVESGHPIHVACETLWRKDGSYFLADYWANPIQNAFEGTICLINVQDVTEREKSAEALRNSEECLHQISGNIDFVFYLWDVSTRRFAYISPAYESISGRSCQKALPKQSLWLDLITPEKRAEAEEIRQRLLAGEEVRAEFEILHPDGSKRYIKEHANPVKDQSGVVRSVAGVAEDVTEAYKTKMILRQNEEKFRRLLTNLPDVSWTTDQNGRVVYMSPKVEAMLGYSNQEIYAGGLNLLMERTHPDDVVRVQKAANALFAHQAEFDVEFRFRRKDGSWVWIHNRAIGAYEREGLILADGVMTDISSRKQAELELKAKTAFLEALVNSTIEGILVVDDNDRRVLYNQRLMQIFKTPAEILQNPDDNQVLNHVAEMVKDPESFLAKIQYLNDHPVETSRDEIEFKDGTCLDRYTAPVLDKDWNYYGRIWSFRDITARKRNEDRLRQFSAAVEQSPVSVVIADQRGNITYVNRKFSECTGYTLEEVVGKNPVDVNSGYASPEVYEHMWATIVQGEEWHGEFQSMKKNGEIFWESAAITPIFDQTGSIAHFLAIEEDITERRAMESELRQAQKLEGIGQLAAGIAHEINTPTQFVMDNLTFLNDSWKSIFELLQRYQAVIGDHRSEMPPGVEDEFKKAEQKADLEFIAEEVPRALSQSLDGARRVANIVRAMKEFSHPDSVEKTETDLNKSIMSTITVARNEWKYVAEMVLDLDEGLPLITCYPGEMNQVILNLVVNAAHAIKEKTKGVGKGTITVSTRIRGDSVEIAISDTGMGIPEEIRTRVYEPFFTTKEVGKGTGQGLALAHSVVIKKHQGKIWFETEVGSGTTFFIHLPIDRPEGAGTE